MITPPWRNEEHDQLRAMAAAGESIVAIARQLKRSTAAVRKRAHKNQVGPFAVRSQGKTKMKLGPRPIGRPWTPTEDAELLALLESKMDRPSIARKLKRHHRRNHATEGSEGQDEMTDEPHLPRFLIRRGARRGWMVWDRHTKGPAKYLGNPAVELPEDHAREIAGELTKELLGRGAFRRAEAAPHSLFRVGAAQGAASGGTTSSAVTPCRLTDPANDPGPHHGPVKGGVALVDNFFVDRVMIGGNRQ
jgi:hypothetical protein